MTNRETEIYHIIQRDPMITQNKIAQQLGLTRSAVSVYLNNMQKKGLIRGRGYLMREERYPVVIGPGHIDVLSVANDTPPRGGRFYYSNETTITYGGATRHVAEYMALLGLHPKAVLSVGADTLGSSFLKDSREKGIDVDSSLIIGDAKTPVYNEIVSADGNRITSAYSSDVLADRITPSLLSPHYTVLNRAGCIVLHDSISPATVDYILSRFTDSKVILFCSMTELTQRHIESFPRFSSIIMPLEIAATALCRNAFNEQDDEARQALTAARAAKAIGIPHIYMPCSSKCDCCIDSKRIVMHTYQNGSEKRNIEYRSYRDVFAASAVYSILNQMETEEALTFMGASKCISEQSSEFFNPNYCMYLVNEVRDALHSEIKYLPI